MKSAHLEPVETKSTEGQRRELPDFLTQGDRALGLPQASPQARIRAGLGLPAREVLPAEGTAAREWLRHVEAGRIGGGCEN